MGQTLIMLANENSSSENYLTYLHNYLLSCWSYFRVDKNILLIFMIRLESFLAQSLNATKIKMSLQLKSSAFDFILDSRSCFCSFSPSSSKSEKVFFPPFFSECIFAFRWMKLAPMPPLPPPPPPRRWRWCSPSRTVFNLQIKQTFQMNKERP